MALLEIREVQRPMAPALMCAARSEIPACVAISATVAGPSASASKMPIELAANRCFAAMKPRATSMIASGVTGPVPGAAGA
jgi:hypothetical protein